jgi:hypothetical protein
MIIYYYEKNEAHSLMKRSIFYECVVHLHDHQNKMVPLMKPSIFVDFSM